MKVSPILFSKAMVQAITSGRKTKTRRIIKGLPENASDDLVQIMVSGHHRDFGHVTCPYGKPGDILWCRETMVFNKNSQTYWPVAEGYGTQPKKWTEQERTYQKVVPSIHVPQSASRIWLRVKCVSVERLHSISDTDAIAEGISLVSDSKSRVVYVNYDNKESSFYLGRESGFWNPITSFFSLWSSINGRASLDANPWVWVVAFEVLSTTGRDNIPADVLALMDGKEPVI